MRGPHGRKWLLRRPEGHGCRLQSPEAESRIQQHAEVVCRSVGLGRRNDPRLLGQQQAAQKVLPFLLNVPVF